jgi:phosphatidylglycerophosphate synthase
VDLHELHTGAEWYDIPDQKRTKVQRLAARTLGIITPGNAVTLLGAIITSIGFGAFWRSNFTAGFILIGLGRICDILDGHIARQTHTSSPVGEGLDAATDKFVILVAAIVLLATHAVPLVLLIPIIVVEAATAFTVLFGRMRGVRLHPARIGKYATFGLWLALLIFLVAHAVGSKTGVGHVLYATAAACGAVALGAALVALQHYVRTINRRRR